MSDRNDPSDLSKVPRQAELTEEVTRAVWRVLTERALRRTLKWAIGLAIVVYFAFALTAVLVRFVVMPNLDAFLPRIEASASRAMHAQVSIAALSARWHGFAPTFEIDGLQVRDGAGVVALSVPHASATLAWRSLVRFAPILNTLEIDAPRVVAIRHADGQIEVAGITLRTSGQHHDALAHWLLTQGAVVIHGGTLIWRDQTRGPAELTLGNIRLAVYNYGRTHRIGVQADGDGTLLRGPLDFRARFRHGVLSDPGTPSSWHGQAYLDSGALDLAALSRYVTLPLAQSAGKIGGHVLLDFSQLKIDSAAGELDGQALALRINPQLAALEAPAASVQFRVQRSLFNSAPQYSAAVRNLSLALSEPEPLADGTPLDRVLTLNQLDATYRPASVGSGQAFSLKGDRLDVGLLAEFARKLPLPASVADQIDKRAPTGIVRNYSVRWEHAATADAAELADPVRRRALPVSHYQIQAALDNISVAPQPSPPGLTPLGHRHLGQPGFTHVSGQLEANEQRGTLALDSHTGTFTVEALFDQPQVDFDTLTGHIEWTMGSNGTQRTIEARTSDLSLSNADTAVQARATYSRLHGGRGALNLHANFARIDVAAVPRYLPSSMKVKVRGYLGHALRGGTGKDATIDIAGDLDYFPFSHPNQPGSFDIVAPFQNGSFDPTPVPAPLMRDGRPQQWPLLEGLSGHFELHREKLGFDVDQGHYRQFVVSNVHGRIPNVGSLDDDLVITGQGAGPLADLLAFAAASPLAVASGHQVEKLHAAGPTALTLALSFPRDGHKERSTVAGSLELMNDTLRYADAPALTELQGKVDFSKHTLALHGLQARFLGEPAHFSGGLAGDGTLAIDASGSMTAAALRAAVPRGAAAAVAQRLEGNVPYTVNVRAAAHASAQITANADLTGLAIDLPAPLGKAAGTAMPLHLSVTPVGTPEHSQAAPGAFDAKSPGSLPIMNKSPLERVEGQLGPLTLAYLIRNADPAGNRSSVLQGAIGINKAVALPSQGVTLDAELAELDFDAWRRALTSLRTPAPAEADARTPPAQATAATDAAAQARPGPQAGKTSDPAALAVPMVESGAAAGFVPTQFKVRIGGLHAVSRQWTHLAIDGSHLDGRWQADLMSDQAAGRVAWNPVSPRSTAGELQARLSRLHVPAAEKNDQLMQDLRTEPHQFPAIDVVVDDLVLANRDLGKLELQARNLRQDDVPVWQLDQLRISNPAATLVTTGSWRLASGDAGTDMTANTPGATVSVLHEQAGTADAAAVAASAQALPDAPADPLAPGAPPASTAAPLVPAAPDPRRTELAFRLDVSDGGALLNRLGLPHTLEHGSGVISGNIGWRGGPNGIDTRTLDGALAAEIKRGQLLKVNPGLAKLLGVLSLQSLARLLTLDFSGIFGHGLPFDSLNASTVVQNGVVRIEQFKLNTSPAKISMSGSTDLTHETQDLHVTVLPTLSASSAALAATAINPVLGLSTFVAQLVVSDSLSHVLARHYDVSGSWAKPVVRRITQHGETIVANPMDPGHAPREPADAH